MTLPPEYIGKTAQCGRCQRIFFPLLENTVVVCPYCQTTYRQVDDQWACKYRMILNPSTEIPLDKIISRYNYSYKDATLALLIENIRKEGLLYPIVVREGSPKKYVLMDGLQRFLAVKSLGWKSIPCLVIPNLEKL